MSDYFPTFDELIAQASEITLAQGYHYPTVFIRGDRGDGIIVMPELPDTFEERAGAMYVLGYEISRQAMGRLEKIYFISEGWLMMLDPGEDEMSVMPSQDPDRIEVLLFHEFIVRGRRNEMVALRMLRDAEGTLVDLVLEFDSRESNVKPESGLMRAFMQGYQAGRKGRIPPTTGPRG